MNKFVDKITLIKITIPTSIIVIALIIILALIIGNNYTVKQAEGINLIINNNNVTTRLKQSISIENNVIYMSIEDIENFFDKYIYQDEETGKIVTTYESKIASLELESNTIEINGYSQEMNASPKEQNGTIFLPISEMAEVYNIEINNIEETNIVTMDSLDREQIKAYVTKNKNIKAYARGIFSGKVASVEKNEWVIYISEVDNGYAKVRTSEGKIGYIKQKYLTNFETVREAEESEKQIEGKVNMFWDYFSEYASAPDRSGTEIEGVNVVSPSFFYIDDDATFNENVGEDGLEYIEWAHENGYKVWAMVSNAEAGISVTSEILNSYESRQRLIENIVRVCEKYNLDGINMDFENMYEEDKDVYSRLIIELTPRLSDLGLVTSVDVTAPDGAETWSLCYDRNVIGDVADYIIFMAYDQYGTSSATAGTTAGYNWVETNLVKFIETEEIETEKIILGIPFYTRLWTEENGEVKSRAVNMNAIDSVLPENVEREWNDTLKQYYVEYTEGTAIKKMWIEDLESIKAKVSLISEYNLGGVAAWEKDRELEEVWTVIKEALE